MSRPRLLDLFCGAGGAGMGYHRAGFDVTGVDTKFQKNYPFTFVQADATVYPLDGYAAVHASPPCQHYSQATVGSGKQGNHPDLVQATVDRLTASGLPWVVENVPGAPMPGALVLCGSEFGLRAADRDGRLLALRRHRLFGSNVFLFGAGGCSCANDRHYQRIAGAYGGGRDDPDNARLVRHGGYTPTPAVRRALLGIDWPMTQHEVNQAIPPAFTQFVGEQLLAYLAVAA